MLKNELFLNSIAAGLHKKKAWVISAFSIISEGSEDYKTNPYEFRLVQTPIGHSYVSTGVNGVELIPITDSVPGRPLYSFKDVIELSVGALENVVEPVTTTLGNVLFNACCFVYAFGNKIKFMTGEIKAGAVEAIIVDRLTDTPEANETRDPSKIYVDEYIKFVDAVYYLTNFTQLCVWASTEKVLTPPPGIVEYRNKLLEENKDRLHDASVIAAIDAKLVEYDAQWLKGDPGEKFLLSNKSRAIVRKKLFLMTGAEAGLDGSVDVKLVKNALSEGWDVNKFPDMINSLRLGSYNRGAETQQGGESVKWLLRASSNLLITKDDCGSNLGKQFNVTKENMNRIVGFTALIDNKNVKIKTMEEASSYLGQVLTIRSPMFCKLDKTDFCSVCVGDKLAQNPTGLSLAVSEYGSQMMTINMQAAHAKQLTLAKLKYQEAIF